ncbi:DUF2434 domain-containing protein [Pleurostoma richardsiae]|uniref:DUF2434 domain-containing protein n=1 Tax=Pleurostoma richardsiae TaxID=41990 RepID=A0AA38VI41_9PEZI|nr:DUF2434 domain-containing protein [Pleurostoma richardsiae]
MSVFDARDILAFPGGDNSTDTVIGGLHFNLTTLDHYNYTYFSNGTLSNGSRCLLTFEPYTPKLLFPNGTWINSTSCYSPINNIQARSAIGLGFLGGFGIVLVLTLMNLRKHGRLYLPAEKRFYPIGRRWQWYWAIIVCAMSFISLITNVDVDRYYLPQIPIVLNTFFWFLMQMGTMAAVWEAVRHWGSWMERQYIDPNPFVLHQFDRRGMFEFYLPLIFYLFWWLNFFLVVPRSWSSIELQRSPEQALARAIPAATGGRFKAAAFCLLVCWIVTAVSLRHSIKHYCARNRGFFNRAFSVLRYAPFRFILMLPLALALVAYQALCAWRFQWSPLNVHGNNAAIYAGGYAPSLLILIIQVIHGFVTPNEDRELQRQRRIRGLEHDREMGLVRKPAWWRRINSEHVAGESMRERIARNVRELGGGRATARNIDRELATRVAEQDRAEAALNGNFELGSMGRTQSGQPVPAGFDASKRSSITPYGGKSETRRTERTLQVAAGLLFPNATPSISSEQRRAELMMDGPPPPYPNSSASSTRGRTRSVEDEDGARMGSVTRTTSNGTLNSINQPPQQVKSMLDL